MLAMDRDTNGNDYDRSQEEDFIVDYDDDPDENDGEYLLADEIEDTDQQEYCEFSVFTIDSINLGVVAVLDLFITTKDGLS